MSCVDMYNGKIDQNIFIMSFETAIPLARGDNCIMARLLLAITDITKIGYSAGGLTSNYEDPLTFEDLNVMRKGPKESLRSYVRLFIHVKCQASGLRASSPSSTG